jgi:hypothetical protein
MESEGSVKQDMESDDSVKQDMESDLDRATSDSKTQLQDKRRVFISCKFPGDLVLEEGTLVLRKVGLSFLPFLKIYMQYFPFSEYTVYSSKI